jgi:hypothetical protein
MLTMLLRPHTPRMKIRSKEEALVETPFLKFDDNVGLTQDGDLQRLRPVIRRI